MRIIFFGTGDLAVPSLKKIASSGHEIAAVITQPDKKKGRGWGVHPSQVKALAEKILPGIDVFQPEKASEKKFIDQIKEASADVFVVVDYGQILSKELLDVAGKYAVNLHPSLLPKYRGASPINQVILNGDTETGNTIIRITEKMDAGDIILQEKIIIDNTEDAVTLSNKLSLSGADLMTTALDGIGSGQENFIKQDESHASYAPKITKEQGEIDWTRSAAEIDRKIRGLRPWPGTFSYISGRRLKIIEASVIKNGVNEHAPGTVCIDSGIKISSGKGVLLIKKLQLEGKKPMITEEFIKGYQFKNGEILGKK